MILFSTWNIILASSSGSLDAEANSTTEQASQTQFVDHFESIKKDSRTLPVSGNFKASYLTEPFSTEQVNIFFGQSYKADKPVIIKVSIEEPPLVFGLMSTNTEFEVKITPRN